MSHQEIISPHISNSVKRCFEEEIVLVIQDTTYLNYSRHPQVRGMGYIGEKEKFIGMLVHNVYGVSGKDKKPLGLINQQVIIREKRVKEGETKRKVIKEKRE